jgi:hypothetical protein
MFCIYNHVVLYTRCQGCSVLNDPQCLATSDLTEGRSTWRLCAHQPPTYSGPHLAKSPRLAAGLLKSEPRQRPLASTLLPNSSKVTYEYCWRYRHYLTRTASSRSFQSRFTGLWPCRGISSTFQKAVSNWILRPTQFGRSTSPRKSSSCTVSISN